MVLNVQNQLDLLYDLLSLHAEECCGSHSECEQIKRLIHSIQQKPDMEGSQLVSHLDQIYQYGETGGLATNIDQHIQNHQGDIQQWLHVIKDSNH
ncbi:hypothetical protein J416_14228 [Gracilibacillus halophilus YIM-C55.5]|uniref:YtzH-like protein n=1 Tax=Gracilibacillus halophilus YIM-C55.5 TaxID=1308866 RepID=N4W980_9BACI|nr:YtzH-like family protein [Gracilibacillus halophilus]ENH95799.1 hypothetical protein J416_14228 [Gracilibacillus halophilus YIM-C55.5]